MKENGKREKIDQLSDADSGAGRRNESYELVLGKLTERIKELNCLYGISKLVESTTSIEEILNGAVELIPKAWQYPEISFARIRLGDREFLSGGFKESAWKQEEPVRVDGEECGSVEVFYIEPRPARDEGPFLSEERDLIHAIAERLGHMVSRVEAGKRLESLYASEKKIRRELQNQMNDRVEFTRRLIHELKTPITSLLATSQLLREELKDDRLGRLSKYVFENATRMNDRIDELHDIIKGEIGRPDVELRPVNLPDLLRAIFEEMRSLAGQSGVELKLIMDDEGSKVTADATRVRQILVNLLNNAFKYASGGGAVEVRTATGPGEVTVQVRDYGPGIPEEEQERIFEPYYRSPDKAKSSHGLGIGLALCKVLVTAHGGKIWTESKAGQGTDFYFTLKRALEE
ncbi:MAG: HAMP domain-containing histidine kinase [Spirochaetales bacterium]|nr:HAMP domain-containing histidine kinase [Spirochaetales bacterium]